jgi:hypothetical protein
MRRTRFDRFPSGETDTSFAYVAGEKGDGAPIRGRQKMFDVCSRKSSACAESAAGLPLV